MTCVVGTFDPSFGFEDDDSIISCDCHYSSILLTMVGIPARIRKSISDADAAWSGACAPSLLL